MASPRRTEEEKNNFLKEATSLALQSGLSVLLVNKNVSQNTKQGLCESDGSRQKVNHSAILTEHRQNINIVQTTKKDHTFPTDLN